MEYSNLFQTLLPDLYDLSKYIYRIHGEVTNNHTQSIGN